MLLNGHELVDRHNRPGASQRVGLRLFFINDGVYTDPNDISSVILFQKDANTSPSTILNSDALINVSSTAVSSLALMGFGTSAEGTGGALAETDYDPGTQASGIYRIRAGEYVAVLDGTINLSGGVFGIEIANQVSTVNSFIDVWTVRMLAASNYVSIINNFKLFDNTFFVITEPMILSMSNRLTTKHITFGSKIDLKVETEIAVQNRANISDEIKNIFRDSVIVSAQMQIVKFNDEPNLASQVTVSAYADTSSTIDVTSDNTLLFNWNTEDLKTHASTLDGTMGSLTGNYGLRVKYTVLKETIVTPFMHFIVQ